DDVFDRLARLLESAEIVETECDVVARIQRVGMVRSVVAQVPVRNGLLDRLLLGRTAGLSVRNREALARAHRLRRVAAFGVDVDRERPLIERFRAREIAAVPRDAAEIPEQLGNLRRSRAAVLLLDRERLVVHGRGLVVAVLLV